MPTSTVIITSHQHLFICRGACTAITNEGSQRLPKRLKKFVPFWLVCTNLDLLELPSHSGLFKLPSYAQ